MVKRWLKSLGIERGSDELAREQFRLLSEQTPLLYGVVIVNSLFMAFATLPSAGPWLAFGFPALAVPPMMYRLWTWRKRALGQNHDGDIGLIRKALRGNIIVANVFSILLGIWAATVLQSVSAEYRAFIPLFTILSMTACAYCLMALPLAAYSVLGSGTVMIAMVMGYTGDRMLFAMAGNIALACLLIVYMVARQYNQLRRIVASRSKFAQQRTQATKLAHQDQLTGLPNRRALIETLGNLHAKKSRSSVAIVMIDLNGFKPVNDTYGHAAGDELLLALGRRLKDTVGASGMVARLGGDEFAVLFENPRDVDWIYQSTERMLKVMSQPIALAEHELRIGAAFGIAMRTKAPKDPFELIRHADIALYEAKGRSNSAISLFEGSMEARVQRRTKIEQALSDREQMRGITLNYQPIFALRGGVHVGFEALARWEHPELGRIAPIDFVEAAERNGLATRLTIHLFRQAVETAKSWPEDIQLSFNLSGSGLGTSGLDKLLPDILNELDFDPGRLAVEVTETALLSDPVAARRVLEALQKIGVRIVLDDFGAGYASIGYLREMRFDGIKLDGSLIADITINAKSRELLTGVLHLCQAIGANVTAEMVESEAQLQLLRALPIDRVQGYLLGEPVADGKTRAPEAGKEEKRRKLFRAAVDILPMPKRKSA